MNRSAVSVRPATADDVAFLAELWADSLRRAEPEQRHADLARILARVEASADDRIVVAEHDGEPAGAIYLCIAPLSLLNLDPAVQAHSLHVLPRFRRRGVGRHLMAAAVDLAEDRGVGHIATAASAGSRESNRFMARLALGPRAVFRIAATHAVRAKLTAQTPARQQRRGGRQLTQLMATRRSQRGRPPTLSGESVGWHQRAGDA